MAATETVAMPSLAEPTTYIVTSAATPSSAPVPSVANDSSVAPASAQSQSRLASVSPFFGVADTYQPSLSRISRANIAVANSIDDADLLLAYRVSSWMNDFVSETASIDSNGETAFDTDGADHNSVDEAFADFNAVLGREPIEL